MTTVRGSPMGVRASWPLLDAVCAYFCAYAEDRGSPEGRVAQRGVTCGDDALFFLGPPRGIRSGAFERLHKQATAFRLELNRVWDLWFRIWRFDVPSRGSLKQGFTNSGSTYWGLLFWKTTISGFTVQDLGCWAEC